LVLSWLLFPAVAALIMGFFLDCVAAAVEALDYPGQPATRPALGRDYRGELRLSGMTDLDLSALRSICLAPA
jgi:uncharacterized protein involved in cysteine biosynthesis